MSVRRKDGTVRLEQIALLLKNTMSLTSTNNTFDSNTITVSNTILPGATIICIVVVTVSTHFFLYTIFYITSCHYCQDSVTIATYFVHEDTQLTTNAAANTHK